MTHRRVQDMMSREVVTVQARTPVKEIAEVLDAERVSAVPVVDSDGRVVGVVSEADLLHRITYQDDNGEWPALLRRHRTDRLKATGLVARDVMTANPTTVPPDASVVQAATLMERHGVKRLPVVDGAGTLVGIVSRRDLVRLLARPDAEIQEEVRRTVIDRLLFVPPAGVTVDVRDGVVTLAGQLQSRTDTRIAVDVTSRIDGVVRVIDKLTYVVDDTSYQAMRREASQPVGPFF